MESYCYHQHFILYIVLHDTICHVSDEESDTQCSQHSMSSVMGSKDVAVLPRVAASLHVLQHLVEIMKTRRRRVTKIPLEISHETLEAANSIIVNATKHKMILIDVSIAMDQTNICNFDLLPFNVLGVSNRCLDDYDHIIRWKQFPHCRPTVKSIPSSRRLSSDKYAVVRSLQDLLSYLQQTVKHFICRYSIRRYAQVTSVNSF